ncbi:MAG: nucleoside 2-deoxyribosyltransferase [Calditrichaeota bacterium]|nr:nucleoside 2-deoxyribosyltransferase [Calditrichota bacterium]
MTKSLGPDFERLRTTLFGGQADRVPLLELAIDLGVMGGYIGRKVETLKDQIDFFVAAGYDYIRLAPIVDFNPAKIQPKEGLRQSAASQSDRERTWSAEGAGVITTMEEFERYRWPRPEEIDYRNFEIVQELLPDGMKIIGQYGDIFTMVWERMGFETFSYALVENPELVARLFDTIGGIVYGMFATMADIPNVGALFYSDDIAFYSGLLCSPGVLRTYLFPWMRKIADLCRQRQMPFIYHTDGRLWEVMDDLIELGVNALQPIEPKAMDIREVKARYGHRLCLVGNVDVDLLARGTPDEVRKVTRELIRDVGPGGGYCVGSGNTVPNYVPVENFAAMVETVHKYGRYPLEV